MIKRKNNYIIACLVSLFSFSAMSQGHDSPISSSTSVGNDEGEAHIAINPMDSSKMIMGYMESGNALSLKIYSSSDAGDTWQLSSFSPENAVQADVPSFSLIGGGDIVFAYDNLGDVYCSWITLWADLNSTAPVLDSCLWKANWAKSSDNGSSFTMQTGGDQYFAEGLINANGNISVYDADDGIADRQWMAIDLEGANENDLYIGYINYPFDLQQTGLKVKRKAASSNSFSPQTLAYSGNGQFTNIGLDKSGTLHYTFVDIQMNNIYHVSSTDAGQTFSNPHLIYNAQNVFPQGNGTVNSRENAAPSLAIDGDDNLHLVWGDFPNGQALPPSFYSISTDGGTTWSTPVDLTTIFSGSVFMPVVSAHGDRISIAGNVLTTDKKSEYYIALSDDNGSNFANSVKMSSGITDFAAIGLNNFVGDYSSSVRTHCTIYSLWTDCRANGCKQYIAKYNQCANVGLVELTPIESSFRVSSLYPNPVKENITIAITSEERNEGELKVIDAQGRILMTKNISLELGKNEHQLSTSDLEAGSYFIRFSDKSGVFMTRTFVKN